MGIQVPECDGQRLEAAEEGIDMGYVFNFPAIAGDHEPKEVLAKIQEELGEFQAESGIFTFIDDEREFDRLNLKAVIELLDVIHACETMLRAYENRDMVDAAFREVIRKNEERGYYYGLHAIEGREEWGA